PQIGHAAGLRAALQNARTRVAHSLTFTIPRTSGSFHDNGKRLYRGLRLATREPAIMKEAYQAPGAPSVSKSP
ncbi:MAG: hypothetical protein ABJ015_22935, partial [Rhodopirellula bahusiensis]